jgi:hypothetical protein
MPIFLVLDTSMLYDQFCCVRISMIYMNRAIPVAWRVLKHNSSSVKYEQYAYLLEQAPKLLPKEVKIFFPGRPRFCMQGLDAPPSGIGVDLAHTSKREPKATNHKRFYNA